MIYLQLFWSFFQIGLFSIGGGYAALPLIQNQVVDIHHWLNIGEFTDLITISQMTPGPIATNSSTFVGMRIAGFWGAVVSTAGNVLPSCIIVLLLAFLYSKYNKLAAVNSVLAALRPASVALIASAGVSILLNTFFGEGAIKLINLNWIACGLFAVCMCLLRTVKPNPIYVILGSGIAGMLLYLL